MKRVKYYENGVMYVTDDRAGVIYKITYLSLDQNYDDEGF